MKKIPVLLILTLAACNGSQNGTDGGSDAADADGGTPIFGPCPFPYSVPQEHTLKDEMGGDVTMKDAHVRCHIVHENVDAEIFIKAEPVEIVHWHAEYEPREGYVCKNGQVEALPAGTYYFAWGHHSWKEVEAAFDGRRYVFDYSDMCVGARPCTPWPDQFDVRSHPDDVLLAEAVPGICAGVGEKGYPAPFVPQVRIPPGTDMYASFTQGSTAGDTDEQPLITFDLYQARLDTREATWSDFAPFLSDHGNDCDSNSCINTQGEGFHLEETDGIWHPQQGFEDHPVVGVTWHGANAYCNWRRMALPDESHWEAAASSLGTRKYPWGDQDPTCDLALYDACSAIIPDTPCSHSTGNTPEGICDLAGNVSEWLRCGYLSDFYTVCENNECAGCTWRETFTKVIRGGSYATPAHNLRATDRDHKDPTYTAPDLGLRCMSTNPSF
jgi:formylglycine-generating enzyme required for sulfatase activity